MAQTSFPSDAAAPASLVAPQPRDSLGCTLSQLEKDQELGGAGIRFHRKRTGDMPLGHVATPGGDRGFLVGVSLRPGHRRRILHNGQSTLHMLDPGTVYVRDFAEDYRADLHGAFDFVLVELSRAAFQRANDERIGSRVCGLQCVTGLHDPVLHNLAQALTLTLKKPNEASALSVEQIGVVIGTHVFEQYGSGAPGTGAKGAGPRLSPWNEARAKEMLRTRLDGGLLISDIADACRLSTQASALISAAFGQIAFDERVVRFVLVPSLATVSALQRHRGHRTVDVELRPGINS